VLVGDVGLQHVRRRVVDGRAEVGSWIVVLVGVGELLLGGDVVGGRLVEHPDLLRVVGAVSVPGGHGVRDAGREGVQVIAGGCEQQRRGRQAAAHGTQVVLQLAQQVPLQVAVPVEGGRCLPDPSFE
jgi:hypothetical protein